MIGIDGCEKAVWQWRCILRINKNMGARSANRVDEGGYK